MSRSYSFRRELDRISPARDRARVAIHDKIADRVGRGAPSGPRQVVYETTPIGDSPQQTDFENYRLLNKTKFPFRIRLSIPDAWSSMVMQYDDVQLSASLDDAMFEMPH
jgi:hypothetical protein